MGIYLEKVMEPLEIPEALKTVIGTESFECFRFFDDCVYDEGKSYNTYKIVTRNGAFVLKKYGCSEDRDAEVKHYSLLAGLPVPELLGASGDCILMRFAEGDDLKDPTDEGVFQAAVSLSAVMNAYPMGRGYDASRYGAYLRRLERRAGCLKDEPLLKKAFGLFFERQKTIPLSLSNADLLPINVLFDGEKAILIDWEFGGFLPYSLDMARFIAHTTPDGSVTSFRMSSAQQRLFTDTVYARLLVKPDRMVFVRDLKLAVLNEYVEILEYYLNDTEAERGDVFGLYYPKASALAEELIREGSR